MTDGEPVIVSVDALRDDGKILKHFNIPVELPSRPPKAISRNSFIKTLPLKKRYQQRLVPKYSLNSLERIRRHFSRNILKQMLQEPKKRHSEKTVVPEGPLDLSNGHQRKEPVFKKPENPNPRVVFVPARAPPIPSHIHHPVSVRCPEQNLSHGIYPRPEAPVPVPNYYPSFPTDPYKFPDSSYLRKTLPPSAAANYRPHPAPQVSYYNGRIQRIQPAPYPSQIVHPHYYYPSPSSTSEHYRSPTQFTPPKYPPINYYPFRSVYLPPQSVQKSPRIQEIPANCQRVAPYPAVEKTHHSPEHHYYVDSRIAVPKPAFCEDIPVYRVRNPYYPNYQLSTVQEPPANVSFYPHDGPQC
ncbi:hypothetical protein DMENIID0001_000360 [Sergentomyia squamirostris]